MVLDEDAVFIDAIDARLLEALQQDCKAPLARLGEQVGLSAPSVMERVRKLEQAGVIRTYEAVLDPRRLGLDVTAFVSVSLNYPRHKRAFEERVVTLPAVLECHHVTGASTFLLKVRARNTEALEDVIGTLREIDGVERTETNVVLSTQKETGHVPIPASLQVPGPRLRRGRRHQDGAAMPDARRGSRAP